MKRSSVLCLILIIIGIVSAEAKSGFNLELSAKKSLNSFGEIIGQIFDAETGETIPGATIRVLNGPANRSTVSDLDGFYTLKPLDPGTYEIEYSFVGLQRKIISDVVVHADQIKRQDVELANDNLIEVMEVKADRYPLLIPGKTCTGLTLDKKQIQKLPTRNVNSMAGYTAGVFQSDAGSGINVRGARVGSTQYIVDGIKQSSAEGIPSNAISSMQVITGGLPAKYGDTTGGVVILQLKSYWDH